MGFTVSLHDHGAVLVSIPAGTVLGANATVAGAEVDHRYAETHHIMVEVGAYTDGTHAIELYHRLSTDDTAARVAFGDLVGRKGITVVANACFAEVVVSDASFDGTVIQLGYIGQPGLLRVDVTSSSVTTGVPMSATLQQATGRDDAGETGANTLWQGVKLETRA